MKRRRSSPRPKRKTLLNLQALEQRAVPSHGNDDFDAGNTAAIVQSNDEKCTDDDGARKSECDGRNDEDRSSPTVAVPVAAVPPSPPAPIVAPPVAAAVPPVVPPIATPVNSGGSRSQESSGKNDNSNGEQSNDASPPAAPRETSAPAPPTKASGGNSGDGKAGSGKTSDGKQSTATDSANTTTQTDKAIDKAADKPIDPRTVPGVPIALADRAVDKSANAVPVNGPVAVQMTDSRTRIVTTPDGAPVAITAEQNNIPTNMAGAIVLEELPAAPPVAETGESPAAAAAPAPSIWALPEINASDLMARFTPFDPAALDEQVNRFLDGLCVRQSGLSAWMAANPWALWATAALAGVTTVQVARRKHLPQKGTRFLSLSPFLTRTKSL
jgi:hypothetical protein